MPGRQVIPAANPLLLRVPACSPSGASYACPGAADASLHISVALSMAHNGLHSLRDLKAILLLAGLVGCRKGLLRPMGSLAGTMATAQRLRCAQVGNLPLPHTYSAYWL